MTLTSSKTMQAHTDPYADLIAQYGAARIAGLHRGTHTITRKSQHSSWNKGTSAWQEWLRGMTVDEMWHAEDLEIAQRGIIYRAAKAIGYKVRVHQAKKHLGNGAKGIVIERLK